MAKSGTKAQLIQARQTAHASLINAHQVGGTGGANAPLVSSGSVGGFGRNRYTNWSGPTVEVGGDKKADKPAGVAIADMNPERGAVRGDASGKSKWVVGNKRFTQAEVNNIINRGMKGASLNAQQRAVFDAMKKEHDEQEALRKRVEEEERVRKVKLEDAVAEEKRRNEEWDRRMKVNEKIKLADEKRAAETATAVATTKYEREQADKARERQFQMEKLKQQQLRREMENGRTSDMTDDDYAKWVQMGGERGRATWDYEESDKENFDNARREIMKNFNDGVLSEADRDAALGDLEKKMAGTRKVVKARDGMPESDPVLSEDGRFYWIPNGTGGGTWTPYADPEQKSAEAQQAARDKQAQDLEKRKDEYLLKSLEYAQQHPVLDAENNEVPVDEKAVLKAAGERWDAVHGQGANPTPNPTPNPIPNPGDPGEDNGDAEDWKKNPVFAN